MNFYVLEGESSTYDIYNGDKRLIFVSSCSVYDWQIRKYIFSASSSLSACKKAALHYLKETNLEFFLWSQENTLTFP